MQNIYESIELDQMPTKRPLEIAVLYMSIENQIISHIFDRSTIVVEPGYCQANRELYILDD